MKESNVAEHSTDENIWKECLKRMAAELPAQQFHSWLRPLKTEVSYDEKKLRLLTPNRISLDYIRKKYSSRIKQLLREISGCDFQLDLDIAPRAVARNRANATQSNPQSSPISQLLTKTPQSLSSRRITQATAPNLNGATTDINESSEESQPTRLNPTLTFETLIEGQANRMARASALQVAHKPGQDYNPLFIYGGVGLGKTHLIHAIGNQMLVDNPNAKVLYIHAEQFVSDVVSSYQRKTFDAIKKRYHSLDLLLIDDVQFIAGKERTQEEFFNAFEALLSKKSNVVMTSDTFPHKLENVSQRLVSRFAAGLSVSIEPPGLEMRVAILINKAKTDSVALAEDVAFFIAKNVRSNVRELEGALRKVLAFSRFNNKPISIPVAREALRDLLSLQNRQVGVENIQKTVADFYKIKIADMHSKKRPASIAKPRQIAMYLAKEMTQKSLPEIGEMFGGRDHTTVLHAVRKISQERTTNTELNDQLHVLEQTLKH